MNKEYIYKHLVSSLYKMLCWREEKKRWQTIYDELLNIRMSLNRERTKMSAEQYNEYQTSLDNAFKYVRMLDIKISNAKKQIAEMAKSGNLTSPKDAVLFTSDDDLLI